MPRSGIGAAQGLLQLAGTAGQGAGANGREALPLMVCRVAALPWTSPSPSWRSSWAKRSWHVRNEAPQHLDDQLQATAETPDDIAPRLDQFARVRCRCRRALAPLLPR